MALSNKDLVRKYINGNCTKEELSKVKALMLQSDYRMLFDELLSEEGNPVVANTEPVDPQMQIWTEKMSQKIAESIKPEVISVKKPFFLRYAAIWALMTMGVGAWGVSKFISRQAVSPAIAFFTKYNPNGKRTLITLPDHSTVLLGSGSMLRFPSKFNGGAREISLEGEAFFEITKDPKRPFIIHTGTIQTKVLGTSFQITAFKNRVFTVAVATGKVRVDLMENQQLHSLAILTPGQQTVYTQGHAVNSQIRIEDLKAWKDGHLIHQDTPLKTIAEELERWYNVKISITNPVKENMLMDVNLTANTPIDKIMKVLSASGKFKYKIHGNTIVIL